MVGVRPFARDPDPSPLIEAIPAAVHSPTRIAQPMVRRRMARERPGSGEGRGREPFVPVSGSARSIWSPASSRACGASTATAAIMGGSQGWASAGIFHEARAQLRRFLAACRRLRRPDDQLQLRHGADLPAAHPRLARRR